MSFSQVICILYKKNCIGIIDKNKMKVKMRPHDMIYIIKVTITSVFSQHPLSSASSHFLIVHSAFISLLLCVSSIFLPPHPSFPSLPPSLFSCCPCFHLLITHSVLLLHQPLRTPSLSSFILCLPLTPLLFFHAILHSFSVPLNTTPSTVSLCRMRASRSHLSLVSSLAFSLILIPA